MRTSDLEQATAYKYLGHGKAGRESNFRNIKKDKSNMATFSDLIKSKIPITLNRKAFNVCVFTVLTYGAENLSLTKKHLRVTQVVQRRKKSKIMQITLKNMLLNVEIRLTIRIDDVVERITNLNVAWLSILQGPVMK